jgi:hypothetical protein
MEERGRREREERGRREREESERRERCIVVVPPCPILF